MATDNTISNLLTISEVSRTLGIAERTIQRFMGGKKISYYKMGRSVRFSKAGIEEFLKKTCINSEA